MWNYSSELGDSNIKAKEKAVFLGRFTRYRQKNCFRSLTHRRKEEGLLPPCRQGLLFSIGDKKRCLVKERKREIEIDAHVAGVELPSSESAHFRLD
ncbi:hypothetical protein DWB84_06320 [Saccharophagus sp. K07]|uniref:hypothetical protein n=1 Tax=Saccharophagus sp. K07 TaxID=2283636 RepID=UPI0016520F68|nr:hypothetical protein [Saccharophagus sp. K07]MBC6905074.1 hypothetical protein [Saccharophagus sp. K07]